MGIKGAWVGLMLGNVPDFVILALALSKLDAAIVPIDPTTGGRELELILAAAPLRALVTRPRGSEADPRTARARCARPCDARTRARRAAAAQASGSPRAERDRRSAAGCRARCSPAACSSAPTRTRRRADRVLFTADSLGDPKGVLRTDKNTVAAVDHAIAGARGRRQDHASWSRCRCSTPTAGTSGFLPTLKLGSTMFLEEEISARRIGKLIREHEIDVLPGTPTMYAELSQAADREEARGQERRATSPPARGSIRRGRRRVLRPVRRAPPVLLPLDRGRDGRARGQRQVPDDGRQDDRWRRDADHRARRQAVARGGKEGLIWVKSKTLVAASRSARSTAKPRRRTRASGMVAIGAIDKHGWLRTGDLGKLDKTGRLHLTGREDDVVKVDGKRVALGEVEGCLEAFPKVKAAQALVDHRSDGRRDGRRARRPKTQVRRGGDHRSLRAQPRAVQGSAPDRVLRTSSEPAARLVCARGEPGADLVAPGLVASAVEVLLARAGQRERARGRSAPRR